MTKLPSWNAVSTRTSPVPVGSKAKMNASRIGWFAGSFSVPRMLLGWAPPVKPSTWKSTVATAPSATVIGTALERETDPKGKKPMALPFEIWKASASTVYRPGESPEKL